MSTQDIYTHFEWYVGQTLTFPILAIFLIL